MHKGTIEHIDQHRLYIKSHHKDLSKSKHAKHLLLGKEKHKILPVLKHPSHPKLKKGDNVNFEIHPTITHYRLAFFYGIPVTSAFVGFAIAHAITYKTSALLVLTVLFIALGMNIQMLLKKHANPFRQIDIHILGKVTKAE